MALQNIGYQIHMIHVLVHHAISFHHITAHMTTQPWKAGKLSFRNMSFRTTHPICGFPRFSAEAQHIRLLAIFLNPSILSNPSRSSVFQDKTQGWPAIWPWCIQPHGRTLPSLCYCFTNPYFHPSTHHLTSKGQGSWIGRKACSSLVRNRWAVGDVCIA
jgi:hypothetical protein